MAAYNCLAIFLLLAIFQAPPAHSQLFSLTVSKSHGDYSGGAVAAVAATKPANLKTSTSGYSAPAGTFKSTLPSAITPTNAPVTRSSADAPGAATPRVQSQTSTSGGSGPSPAAQTTVSYSRFYIRNNCPAAGTVSVSLYYVPPLTSPAFHALGYFAVAPGTTAYIAPTTNRFIYFNAFGGSAQWGGTLNVLVPNGNAVCEVRSMLQVDLGPTFNDYTIQLNC